MAVLIFVFSVSFRLFSSLISEEDTERRERERRRKEKLETRARDTQGDQAGPVFCKIMRQTWLNNDKFEIAAKY